MSSTLSPRQGLVARVRATLLALAAIAAVGRSRWPACPQRDAPFGHRPSGQSTTRTARHREDPIMGTNDKAQNKAEDLKGQGKEALGRATGDEELEAEGRTDKAKSDLKQAGEKVKDAFTR
jgi:uncharacterized protein YjbJ (UPF0337 family)